MARSQIISTIAGGATGHGGYWGDGGPATDAEIGYFGYVAVDGEGNVYIGDGNNHRVRKVNAVTGIISTIAGTGVAGYNGDGIQATAAQLNYPGAITFDSHGDIYIIDGNNFRIRKIDQNTGVISTYAGDGVMGSNGDGGMATAASITTGYMAWDNMGDLYITCSRKIRKIASSGIINTIAGTGLPGVTGEGVPATSTNLGGPRGLATDESGNVYFGDSTSSIRKVTISSGIITRVAGTGDNIWTPYSGDGTLATACHMGTFGVAVDDTGNIYNSDYGNSRIEKINQFGVVYTIAGTGVAGYSGDGGLASSAQINFPEYVTLDKCNNVYIADFANRRVRKITYRECDFTEVNDIGNEKNETSIHPNPANTQLTIISAEMIKSVTVMNMVGQSLDVFKFIDNKKKAVLNIRHLLSGIYVVQITDCEGRKRISKFVKE